MAGRRVGSPPSPPSPGAASAPLRGPHLVARTASACGWEAAQKKPKRKGKVFQGRGKEKQGWVEKSVKGGQEPAVAPDKGSSDRAKGTMVVLCPADPDTSEVQGHSLCVDGGASLQG